MRIDVPGGWVELRDAKKVPEKLRRPVKYAIFDSRDLAEAVKNDSLTHDQFVKADALTDAVMVALVESWSFGWTPDGEGLLELPGDAYDAVTALVKDHMLELMPSFEEDDDDPKAPGPG